MRPEKIFYVYAHFTPKCSVPFYIGKGLDYRARSKHGRSDEWRKIAGYDYEIEIWHKNLSEVCALCLEKIYIYAFGKEWLVNKMGGGFAFSKAVGRKQTPEANEKRRLALSGEKNHFYGRKLPQWHIDLLIASQPEKQSAETLRKRSISQSGQKHAQFDWNIYEFIHPDHGLVNCLRSELISLYNLSPPKVSNLINGQRQAHGGWKMHGASIPLGIKPKRKYERKPI